MREAIVRVELDGFAAVVAARYLAGAGVRGLVVAHEAARRAALEVDARVDVTVDSSCAAPLTGFEDLDPSAREVAVGARTALDALRNALEASAPLEPDAG